jgi:hypothetical protein
MRPDFGPLRHPCVQSALRMFFNCRQRKEQTLVVTRSICRMRRTYKIHLIRCELIFRGVNKRAAEWANGKRHSVCGSVKLCEQSLRRLLPERGEHWEIWAS